MQINESLPVGTMLDGGSRKYEIKSVLGHGGFGITYLATSTICIEKIPVEVQFAIKEHYISSMNERQGASVSVPNASNTAEVQESIDSFLVEAQRLGRLCDNHPGIVRVNESFRANGTAYYVMEYIKGRSLRDYIKQMPQGRLPEKEALELFRPIIETIAYLHENKVTHLDIKPDNILIRESGEPVIIDFGLSKHYNAKGTPTSTIKAAGCSAGYSPMEQYAGITTFTPEADIYALAATLLYMLTGKDPIISTEINEQIIRQSIPEGVSTETTNAILMAMRKLKEDRTHRVREFSDGLVAKVQKAESVVVQDIPQQKPVRDNNQTQKIQAASQEKTPKNSKPFRIIIGVLCVMFVGIAIYFLSIGGNLSITANSNYSGELVRVKDANGRKGFGDWAGNVIIPCKWKDASDYFYEGLACVKDDNNKWGFIDKTGTVVIPCRWRTASSFSGGLACVQDDNHKYGFIDKTGTVVIPCQWKNAPDFSEGMVLVKDANGKYGFIDKTGKLVIPCQWKEAWTFSEGLARVKDANGKYGFIDKTGKLVIPCQWEYANWFSEGLASVADASHKYGYIDKTGKVVIPCQWRLASSFVNGTATIWIDDNVTREINKQGEIVE